MQSDGNQEAIEIRLLLEAIHAEYGYDLRDYAKTTMRRRVLAALAKSGLSHLGELQHQILGDPRLFAEVLDSLTVQVSEMFRDPSFYRAFRERVVPILRTYPLIRIWHAGCASGEEAYSSAILLSEEGLYERSHVYATDLSRQALDQAKQGIYAAEHLGSFAENHRQSGGASEFTSYFTVAYERLAIFTSPRTCGKRYWTSSRVACAQAGFSASARASSYRRRVGSARSPPSRRRSASIDTRVKTERR